jgi:hypothetical protein
MALYVARTFLPVSIGIDSQRQASLHAAKIAVFGDLFRSQQLNITSISSWAGIGNLNRLKKSINYPAFLFGLSLNSKYLCVVI